MDHSVNPFSDAIAAAETNDQPSHDFTVVDSELLVDAPIIGVRRDQVTMPGGRTAAREIVEHFGAVAVVVLDDHERVRMIRQYRHSVQRRLWELPAGLLDAKSETPLEAAQRELQEEVGLAAHDWQFLGDIVSSPGFCEESVRVYLARDLCDVEQPTADDEEADMTAAWISLDDAFAAIPAGYICNAIAISGLSMAWQVVRQGVQPRSLETPFELRPTALRDRRIAAGADTDLKFPPA